MHISPCSTSSKQPGVVKQGPQQPTASTTDKAIIVTFSHHRVRELSSMTDSLLNKIKFCIVYTHPIHVLLCNFMFRMMLYNNNFLFEVNFFLLTLDRI